MLLSSISLFLEMQMAVLTADTVTGLGGLSAFYVSSLSSFALTWWPNMHTHIIFYPKKKKAANTQPHMLPFSKAYIQSLLQNIRVLRRCQAIVRWRTCDSVLWISATGRNLIHTWVTCCEFKSLLNLQHRGAAEGKRGHAFRPRCLFLMGEESHSRKAE